jgi:hypothetical protein
MRATDTRTEAISQRAGFRQSNDLRPWSPTQPRRLDAEMPEPGAGRSELAAAVDRPGPALTAPETGLALAEWVRASVAESTTGEAELDPV